MHVEKRLPIPDSFSTSPRTACSLRSQPATSMDGFYPAVTASGVIIPYPRGLEVPPGTGLGLVNRAAIAFPAAEVSYVVEEL